MNTVFVIVILASSLSACTAQAKDHEESVTMESESSQNDTLNAQERHKEAVRNFLQEFFGDHNIDAADKYISEEKYIQHNPLVADGREALKTVAAKVFFKSSPLQKLNLERASAEGDLVWVHWKLSNLGGNSSAIVDIFRFENGKIVEHWDVIQPILSTEKSANDHPFF